jgi:hypothetical protein
VRAWRASSELRSTQRRAWTRAARDRERAPALEIVDPVAPGAEVTACFGALGSVAIGIAASS